VRAPKTSRRLHLDLLAWRELFGIMEFVGHTERVADQQTQQSTLETIVAVRHCSDDKRFYSRYARRNRSAL
jgi:hypothetical protein